MTKFTKMELNHDFHAAADAQVIETGYVLEAVAHARKNMQCKPEFQVKTRKP